MHGPVVRFVLVILNVFLGAVIGVGGLILGPAQLFLLVAILSLVSS